MQVKRLPGCSLSQTMFSPTGGSKPRPPAVEVPQSVATDDDEGDTSANSLLAGEALGMLGHSPTATSSSQGPLASQHDDNSLGHTVLAIPDAFDTSSSYDPAESPLQGVDEQPLLQWMQPSSPPARLQRRRSELQAAPARVNAAVHRSMSETADAAGDSTATSNSNTPQPFYGVEPRRPPKRDASSQLLRGSMRFPYRQRSLLSRGSPPLLEVHLRRKSHEYEAAHASHGPEMIEMISNPLSRITSDGPESSGGSIMVELSPDSYEPLQSVIHETQAAVIQLPAMPEEEPEVCAACCPPDSLLVLHGLFPSLCRACFLLALFFHWIILHPGC